MYYENIFILNVIDLNLIPTRLNNSKESMLSAVEHCYLRAMAVETNINNKKNLNKQIGNVYNKYITIYMDEVLSKLMYNLKY